jgi:hypothetical protein
VGVHFATAGQRGCTGTRGCGVRANLFLFENPGLPYSNLGCASFGSVGSLWLQNEHAPTRRLSMRTSGSTVRGTLSLFCTFYFLRGFFGIGWVPLLCSARDLLRGALLVCKRTRVSVL